MPGSAHDMYAAFERPLDYGYHPHTAGKHVAPVVEQRLERGHNFTHHTLHRTIGPKGVCDREAMRKFQCLRHQPQRPVLEMRRSVDFTHTCDTSRAAHKRSSTLAVAVALHATASTIRT